MFEIRNLGQNLAQDLFLVLVTVFNIAGCCMLIRQVSRVRVNEDGQSLSITGQVTMFCMFASRAIWGFYVLVCDLERPWMGLAQQVLRLPFFIVLLLSLHRYKGFTPRDSAVLTVLVAGLCYMPIADSPEDVFVLYQLIGLFALVFQVYELLKEKSPGVVVIGVYYFALPSSATWLTYALLHGDWMLFLCGLPYFILMVLIIALWWNYALKEKREAAGSAH